MIARTLRSAKSLEKVMLVVLIFSGGIISTGCVPIVTSAVISGSADKKIVAYQYLDQTQAFRLDEGMGLEQFDQEMWDYVPAQYSEILRSRIRDYVRKFSKSLKKKGRSTNINAALKEFPNLRTQYEAIGAKKFEYRNHGSFWDMKSMAYRAMRLRDGASEQTIILELRLSDLFFNRRYEQFQKKNSTQANPE